MDKYTLFLEHCHRNSIFFEFYYRLCTPNKKLMDEVLGAPTKEASIAKMEEGAGDYSSLSDKEKIKLAHFLSRKLGILRVFLV